MKLTILLCFVVAFTVTWVALAVVRERALVVGLRIEHALSERFWIAQLQQQTAEHNRILAHYRRGALPPIPSGPVAISPPALPGWAEPLVTVEQREGGERYHYRGSAARALASVPGWFFHGGFGGVLALLAALSLAEGRRDAQRPRAVNAPL